MSLSVIALLRLLGRLLYRAVLLHCWLLLVLYLGFKFVERQFSIASLPASIEPAGVVLIGGESGLREGCGVVVLRMAPALQRRLARQGLAALEEARQARGYPDEAYYSYAPWQPTPVPDEDSQVALGLNCAEADEALSQRINRAQNSPGAFYSSKDEGLLLVIPEEGLIVFGYFG
ncbi:hypothetical protein A9179_01705 [Pseudomonas alcaligenes]|uniref:Uncharacterized protein n=1 Tax=Aquipseudomonas alcaligenes TaxID=43263 RepID=A0ABR7RUV7_AQUAC|nr:hypothetical protein [Pseudomonas alcaligenes]MBC9248981.1 hypothetical protein [Pseudomonas alcaligenes]